MPTDLAFKFAARQAIFAFLERERGEGWWGSEAMADYYAQQSIGDDPFNWIKAHPLMRPAVLEGYPFDHAGQGETSLLMALVPEGVDMSRHLGGPMVCPVGPGCELELGIKGRDRILAHMRKALGVERANAQGAQLTLPQNARLVSGSCVNCARPQKARAKARHLRSQTGTA